MKNILLKRFAISAAVITMTVISIGSAFAYEENNINAVNVQQVETTPATYNVSYMIRNDDFESYNIPRTATAGQDYVATFEKVSGIRTSYSYTNVTVNGKLLKRNADYSFKIYGDSATLTIFGENVKGDIWINVNVTNDD